MLLTKLRFSICFDRKCMQTLLAKFFFENVVNQTMPIDKSHAVKVIWDQEHCKVRLTFLCKFWILKHGRVVGMLMRIICNFEFYQFTFQLLEMLFQFSLHWKLNWARRLLTNTTTSPKLPQLIKAGDILKFQSMKFLWIFQNCFS